MQLRENHNQYSSSLISQVQEIRATILRFYLAEREYLLASIRVVVS